MHRVICHEDQPQIKLNLESVFKSTRCHDLHICVCGGSPNSLPDVWLFFRKLCSYLKLNFPKTKTQISESRALLQDGKIVLQFEMKMPAVEHAASEGSDDWLDRIADGSESPQAPPNNAYFHFGFCNYKSWNFCGMQLEEVAQVNHHGFLELKPSGLPAEDHGVKTVCQFLASHIDLDSAYALHVLEIISDDTILPATEMPGRIVEVQAYTKLETCEIWRGSAIEKAHRRETAANRRSDRPKKAPKGRRAKPSETAAKPQARGRDPIAHSQGSATVDHCNASDDSDSGPGDDQQNDDDHVADYPCLNDESDVEDSEAPRDSESNSGSSSSSSNGDSTSSSSSSSTDDILKMLAEEASSAQDCDDEADLFDPANDSDSTEGNLSDIPVQLGARDEPEVESIARRAPLPQLSIRVAEHGDIRYNILDGYFQAACALHGSECRRRRTASSSERIQGQGRPLGLLTAWLMAANKYSSKQDHVNARSSDFSFDDRLQARQQFKVLSEADDFFAFERPQAADEGEEPRTIR